METDPENESQFCGMFHTIDVSGVRLTGETNSLADRIAENTHDEFVKMKLEEGFKFGYVRNIELKTHPNLVPYDMQTREAKSLDHTIASDLLKMIKYFGFEVSCRHSGDKGSADRRVSIDALSLFIDSFDFTISLKQSPKNIYWNEKFCITMLIPILTDYFDKHSDYFGGSSVYSNAFHQERKLVITLFECIMERIRLSLYPLSAEDENENRRRASRTLSLEKSLEEKSGYASQFCKAVSVKPFVMTEKLMKGCRKCLSKLLPVLPPTYKSEFVHKNLSFLEDAMTNNAAADYSFEILIPVISLIWQGMLESLCSDDEDEQNQGMTHNIAMLFSSFLEKTEEEKATRAKAGNGPFQCNR